MKHAGIDFGTTLVKAFFTEEGEAVMLDTRLQDRQALADALRERGIELLQVTGIGSREGFEGFKQASMRGDNPIDSELLTQMRGALFLLERQGVCPAAHCLFASVGTGTSYLVRAHARGVGVKRKLGNSIGGGLISGLAATLEIPMSEIDALARAGSALDIYVRDLLPATADTFEGAMVVSHFGKAKHGSSQQDRSASLFQIVATVIVRDIILLRGDDDRPSLFGGFTDVVLMGMTVQEYSVLREAFNVYLLACGFTVHIPQHAGFVGAAGAYLQEE